MIVVYDRPQITVKEIKIQLPDSANVNVDEQANDIGRLPYIEIGKQVIEGNQIMVLSLYNDQFLPRITMRFKDSSGLLLDPLFPTDNSILKAFIQSSNDDLMPIRMDFKITEFKPVKDKGGDNNDVVFELSGILNVDYLYDSFFTSYDDTSYNVLRQLAKEAKLGFASNINGTNDRMVWVNPSLTYLEFMQELVKFSFKGLDTFLFAYIDFHYNLNYIDIETALSEDIKGQKSFVGSKFINNNADDVSAISDLVLTTNPDNINSNFYINKYEISNSSTLVNLNIGYIYYASYYDTLGNTVYDLILDTISTSGPDGKQVVTKGGIGEVSDAQRYSSDNQFEGKVDTDNAHKYFLYAYKQNERNLQYLQKIKMKINLSQANFNLYRYQKVNVQLYKVNDMSNDITQEQLDNQEQSNDHPINQRLSGEWLITSINYNYGSNGKFEQEVILVKRELGFNENDFDPNKTY